MVDYSSRYPEVSKLSTATSAAVIATMKGVLLDMGSQKLFVATMGPTIPSMSLHHLQTPMDFNTQLVVLISHRAMVRQRGWCRP